MSKLYITVGLPASGKSTWASQKQAEQPDKIRIVTRDDIRAMCGARFEDGDEKVVARIRDEMIAAWMVAGYDVICADTNTSDKVRRRLSSIAHGCQGTVEYVNFLHIPLDVCLTRNTDRWIKGDCKVPNSAIEKMYETLDTLNLPVVQ